VAIGISDKWRLLALLPLSLLFTPSVNAELPLEIASETGKSSAKKHRHHDKEGC